MLLVFKVHAPYIANILDKIKQYLRALLTKNSRRHFTSKQFRTRYAKHAVAKIVNFRPFPYLPNLIYSIFVNEWIFGKPRHVFFARAFALSPISLN